MFIAAGKWQWLLGAVEVAGWWVGSSVPLGGGSPKGEVPPEANGSWLRPLTQAELLLACQSSDLHPSLGVPGQWAAEDLPGWVLACVGCLRLLLAEK